MTNGRILGLLLLIMLVGLTLCHLRAEQARCAHRIQQLRRQEQELRKVLWDTEVEIARQASPEALRWRLERSSLPLRPDRPKPASRTARPKPAAREVRRSARSNPSATGR